MPGAPRNFRGLGAALVAGSGLLGAAGVVLSAAAAHLAGSASLGIAGQLCLVHAPAVLAIGAVAGRTRLLTAAGVVLLAGAMLFATCVAVHALSGVSLGPLAPVGGTGLIGGWLLVMAAGLRALVAKTPADQA